MPSTTSLCALSARGRAPATPHKSPGINKAAPGSSCSVSGIDTVVRAELLWLPVVTCLLSGVVMKPIVRLLLLCCPSQSVTDVIWL